MHNVTYAGGYGGVFGAWSSVSCSSILCDPLLSHLIVTDSAFADCSVVANDVPSVGATTSPQGGHGGVVYLRDAESRVERCVFTRNAAAQSGGVVAADGYSRLEMYDVMLTENTAGQGGSVAAATSVSVIMSNATFARDVATGQGGSVYLNAVGAVRL